MYELTQLNNGVRVISLPLNSREGVSIGIWIGIGGRFESNQNKGIAHFLEHIVFRGSQKYSCEDIKQTIEGVGGALNAFTCEEQTCFYAKVPAKHLNRTFDVLSDMALFPKFNQKDIERERGIILEEIKMYRDLPQYRVMELLEDSLWPNHPLGGNLAGTFETVKRMSRKELLHFHQKHYSAANIVITVCGKVDHKAFVRLVEKKTKSLEVSDRSQFVSFDSKTLVTPSFVYEKRPIEQMHVALGMRSLDVFHKDIAVVAVLNTILGGNMSSRLFDDLREKRGLAYSVASSARALSDTGMFYVKAGVDNEKLIPAVEAILKNLYKIKHKVKQDELDRAKEYFIGQMVLALEDTMDHMLWFGESVMTKNKLPDLNRLRRKVRKVTVEDMQRVAKTIIQTNSYQLAVVGPITDIQIKKLQCVLGVR